MDERGWRKVIVFQFPEKIESKNNLNDFYSHWNRYKSGQNHLTDFIGVEPSKKRKRRTSFTPQALELLNAHFERNTHPSGKNCNCSRCCQENNFNRMNDHQALKSLDWPISSATNEKLYEFGFVIKDKLWKIPLEWCLKVWFKLDANDRRENYWFEVKQKKEQINGKFLNEHIKRCCKIFILN